MVDEKKDKPKRLIIDIDYRLHGDIKARAAHRNLSIKDYVLQAILTRIDWEKKYE